MLSSLLTIYVLFPSLPIILIVTGLIPIMEKKDILLKHVVSIFGIKISKFTIAITIMIGFLLIFFIISVISLLSYFSILNITLNSLFELELYELLIYIIFGVFRYVLFDVRPK